MHAVIVIVLDLKVVHQKIKENKLSEAWIYKSVLRI